MEQSLSDDNFESLQARIIALELLAIPFIIDQAARGTQSTVTVGVEAMRHVIKASLQNADRPIGDEADRIMEGAVGALDSLFDNARMRAETIDAAGEG